MRITVFLLLGMFLLTVQTTIFHVLPEWVGMPDLLFLLVVFMAIHMKTTSGAILTLVFGTMVEVFSGYFLGLYALAYLLVFFVLKGLSVALSIDEVNHQPPIVALCYLIANGFVYVFSVMLVDNHSSSWSWGGVLQRVLIVIILVVPVGRLFSLVLGLCDRREEFNFLSRRKGNRYRT